MLIGTELPFRLTPNLQDFITPIGIEGLLTASMLALGRGLTEPEVGFIFPYKSPCDSLTDDGRAKQRNSSRCSCAMK